MNELSAGLFGSSSPLSPLKGATEHHWAEEFAKTDAKIGETVRIRLPQDSAVIDKAMAEQGMVYNVGTDEYVEDPMGAERYLAWLESQTIVGMRAGLTRFDPSTKTRVPVTQEWVDEAVAEIVRLNVEIGGGLAQKASAMLSQPNQFAEDILSEQDRIWEAVRAASAV